MKIRRGKRGRRENIVIETEAATLTEEAKVQYEKLVQEVRMRQHELGNQLSAAKGLHSEEAGKYLEELNKDQRHNVFLLCGDPLLAGLLYQKCTESENRGIQVECHLSVRMGAYALPQHELIAMAGVILDNAIESEMELSEAERRIRIVLDEKEGQYRLMIANRFPYVPYETIGEWFETGRTSKGQGRGLGLAHVRKLCAGNGADIAYGNQETDGENEVFFMLYLRKAEGNAEKTAGRKASVKDERAVTTADRKAGATDERAVTNAGETGSAGAGSVSAIEGLKGADATETRKATKAIESMGAAEESRYESRGITGELTGRKHWLVYCLCFACVGLGILAVAGIFLFGSKDLKGEGQEYRIMEEPDMAYTKELAEIAGEKLARTALPNGEDSPYLMYDVEHLPEGGVEVKFPEAVVWNAEAVELATVSYEIYDGRGNCTGRDTYVAAGMDTSSDKREMVDRGQKLYFPSGEFYRRMQECWEYDEEGRKIAYQKYKQYGGNLERELVLMELYSYDEAGSQTMTMELSEEGVIKGGMDNRPNGVNIRICDKDTEGRPLREYEIDGSGKLLWLSEYAYDKDGYPLSDAVGNWTWGAAHSWSRITETDYYGKTYEIVFEYDSAGRKQNGYYEEDGVYYRGYSAVYDTEGRMTEEYDDMPIVRKERLPNMYLNNFYDAERTKPLQPQKNANRYRYCIYGADGEVTHMLDLDAEYGYGDLYVYCYDEVGRLSVTYDYRIWGSDLGNFTLNTPDGERLYFANDNYEYNYYEEYGGVGLDFRYFLTEISLENAAGKLEWIFTFDREGPLMRRFADGSTVDWREAIDLSKIQ